MWLTPGVTERSFTQTGLGRPRSAGSDAALEFDRAGFDSVWVCDHVYGVPNPALPIFEAWSQLAAIGAITENVELGTLVSPPLFRNPGVLAKQVATVDHISQGRVIMGLGAGWFQPEFEALARCPSPDQLSLPTLTFV